MSKGLKIFFIIFLSVITIFVSAFFVILMQNKGNFNFLNFFSFNNVSNKLVLDKTYENIFEKVRINSKAAKIEVKESENSLVKVTVYSDDENYSVANENNILKIDMNSENKKIESFA